MDDYEVYGSVQGCSGGCLATIFKMIISFVFWLYVGSYIFNNIIEGKYGGMLYAPLGWKIAFYGAYVMSIWGLISKPFIYFKRKGYGVFETAAMGCFGFLIGGGFPVIVGIVLLIYFWFTEQ